MDLSFRSFCLMLLTIPTIAVAEFHRAQLNENFSVAEDGRTPISLHYLGRILATVFSSLVVAWIVSFIIIPPIVYCLLCSCGFAISGNNSCRCRCR